MEQPSVGDGKYRMDATSFQFTMTIPGDERLVGAVRELTMHAAKYAQLSDRDTRTLVDDVMSAAAASASAAGGADNAVEFKFLRTADRLDVAIEWEGRAPAAPHVPRTTGSTSTQWTHDGRRQRCLISLRARS
jgi:hypothetical protein